MSLKTVFVFNVVAVCVTSELVIVAYAFGVQSPWLCWAYCWTTF